MIVGSRFVSQWINVASPIEITEGAEGSPIDAAVFGALILGGSCVLIQRSVIAGFIRKNPWLVVFMVYSLLSIAWSDFPTIALKRWIKTLGHPIMALIILTDPKPLNALRIVMKRCAFVLIPFSIMLIKYFPEYGRGYEAWTGRATDSGVTLNKNFLGLLCMVFGIFFVWVLMTRSAIANARVRRDELIIGGIFLTMIIWLLLRADSATSLATFILGTMVMVVLGSRMVNKRLLGVYVIAVVIIVLIAEMSFGLSAGIIQSLGRDPTLTDRTEVWQDALALQDNPLLGAGFESFWLGSRLDVLWTKWAWRPNQAHNGYIETYLNLGLIGVVLLVGVIVSSYRNIARQFWCNPDLARLQLAFLAAILAYNITEATFKGVHFGWTIFFIIAIDWQRAPDTARMGRDGTGAATARTDVGRALSRHPGERGRMLRRP
jgi:O-antigen ligase